MVKLELFSPATLVADVLAISPLAATVFIEMRLNCLGCSMVRFCTMQDLCSHYALDVNKLLTTLQERLVLNASH